MADVRDTLENYEQRFGAIQAEICRFVTDATEVALGELGRRFPGAPAADAVVADAQHSLLTLVARLEVLIDEAWHDQLFRARYEVETAFLTRPRR